MNRLKLISEKFDKQNFLSLHEEMSFSEYLERVYQNPLLIRSSHQYIYSN